MPFNANAPDFSPQSQPSMPFPNFYWGDNLPNAPMFTPQSPSVPSGSTGIASGVSSWNPMSFGVAPPGQHLRPFDTMVQFPSIGSMSTTAAAPNYFQALDQRHMSTFSSVGQPFLHPASQRKRSTTPPVVQPSPTTQYIQQAAGEPRMCDPPRPLLVILDLNGTLIYRKHRRLPPSFERRFGLRQFLQELTEKYVVMIWSSARPETVEAVCDLIFTQEERKKLVVEWGRDKLGLHPKQYNAKVQVYKELHKVWASPEVQARYPGNNPTSKKKAGGKFAGKKTKKSQGLPVGQRWDQSNTVLLDDSNLKAISEPYNIIEIPEFTKVPQTQVDETKIFSKVLGRLDSLSRHDNVSKVMRVWKERLASGDDNILNLDVGAPEVELSDNEDGGVSITEIPEVNAPAPASSIPVPNPETQTKALSSAPQCNDPAPVKKNVEEKKARQKAAKKARKAAKKAGKATSQVTTDPSKKPKGPVSNQAPCLTTENLGVHLQNTQQVEATRGQAPVQTDKPGATPPSAESASTNSLLDRLEVGLGFKKNGSKSKKRRKVT